MINFVYKVCERNAWEAAQRHGFFLGSADDVRDGYIHLSTADQLPSTLGKHFAGLENLTLVCFAVESLSGNLKWETSASGKVYPHYYGSLPVTAALRSYDLPLDAAARHILPGDLK